VFRGRILTLVHLAGNLLAARFAGAHRLSLRLADQFAVSHRWNYAARGVRAAHFDFHVASALAAWTALHLKILTFTGAFSL
jgi:hypothetical protein